MRIAIDARPCTDHFPGIARYIAGLLQGFADLGTGGNEILVLHDPRGTSTRFNLPALTAAAEVELVPVDAGPFSPRQQWLIPLVLHRLRVDLYHATYYLRPYGPLPCPSVTTFYDVIPRRFPGYFPPRTRAIIELTNRLALRRSRRIIAISEATKDDLWIYYQVPQERVSVTPLGIDASFRPQPPEIVADLRRRLDLPERYILYVGSNKPHKNLPRLVRAWKLAREHAVAQSVALVIAGHWDPRYPEARELAASLGLGDEAICWTGPVAESDLPALYSGALAFVFPSLYEGFGLPPLEAMACGVPVVTSYTSAMREVAGDSALAVDPHDYHQIAEAILHVLRGQLVRGNLGTLGIGRSRLFTWERTAALTLRAYRRALQR
ncbi:MAG: glycosyl transferase family 1 [Herpetosiphonaceae bacterium]|nr:MAG: glycosyl transferase family 1 [Herpetosiphonaceae bacterium]